MDGMREPSIQGRGNEMKMIRMEIRYWYSQMLLSDLYMTEPYFTHSALGNVSSNEQLASHGSFG